MNLLTHNLAHWEINSLAPYIPHKKETVKFGIIGSLSKCYYFQTVSHLIAGVLETISPILHVGELTGYRNYLQVFFRDTEITDIDS